MRRVVLTFAGAASGFAVGLGVGQAGAAAAVVAVVLGSAVVMGLLLRFGTGALAATLAVLAGLTLGVAVSPDGEDREVIERDLSSQTAHTGDWVTVPDLPPAVDVTAGDEVVEVVEEDVPLVACSESSALPSVVGEPTSAVAFVGTVDELLAERVGPWVRAADLERLATAPDGIGDIEAFFANYQVGDHEVSAVAAVHPDAASARGEWEQMATLLVCELAGTVVEVPLVTGGFMVEVGDVESSSATGVWTAGNLTVTVAVNDKAGAGDASALLAELAAVAAAHLH